jgi:hypothetical protein
MTEQQATEATEAAEVAVEAVEADTTPQDTTEPVGPEAEAAEPQSAPVKNWSDDDEQEARLFGWKSPDEWKGEKPAGYIDDPKEFLGRVERSRIFQTMQQKMSEQERKLAAMNDKALERQKADYEAQMRQISARQRQAVEEADTETWDRLERQKADLARQAPQEGPANSQAEGPAPEVAQYREQNDWAKDPVLWAEAVQAVNVGLQTGVVTANDAESQIRYAERVVKTKYPHLFSTPKPKPQPQKVDAGGLAGGPKSGRNQFDKLPSEARDAFSRFVKRGVYADTKESREKYAREYNDS